MNLNALILTNIQSSHYFKGEIFSYVNPSVFITVAYCTIGKIVNTIIASVVCTMCVGGGGLYSGACYWSTSADHKLKSRQQTHPSFNSGLLILQCVFTCTFYSDLLCSSLLFYYIYVALFCALSKLPHSS